MYSMVLMAALTTAVDMPDRGGRRGGGCGGCYGGMAWGGCYGGGRGCYGGGWGGCYGGGWGGCYGGGWGGCYGGCYGGGGGCYGMSMGGGGYGGYVLNGSYPMIGSYAFAPTIANSGTPLAVANGTFVNPGMTQSFYANPGSGNQANEATIVVHLPENARLTIDGQPTQSRSSTRTFHSPPLEPGKTYTYTLRAELNREGQNANTQKTIDVRAGQHSEVTLNFDQDNGSENRNFAPNDNSGNQINPVRPRRTPPAETLPGTPPIPTPPRDR